MARADSRHSTPASAPSRCHLTSQDLTDYLSTRRGLLKGMTAALATLAAGAAVPVLSDAAPMSALAAEFRRLVAEANKAFEAMDVLNSTPESLAAEARYQETEASISTVMRQIWEHPARTWDDVTLRAEAAAYVSEYGPVHGGSGHARPDHERSLDELINAVLAVARAH